MDGWAHGEHSVAPGFVFRSRGDLALSLTVWSYCSTAQAVSSWAAPHPNPLPERTWPSCVILGGGERGVLNRTPRAFSPTRRRPCTLPCLQLAGQICHQDNGRIDWAHSSFPCFLDSQPAFVFRSRGDLALSLTGVRGGAARLYRRGLQTPTRSSRPRRSRLQIAGRLFVQHHGCNQPAHSSTLRFLVSPIRNSHTPIPDTALLRLRIAGRFCA
jgi:hypothetical protein